MPKLLACVPSQVTCALRSMVGTAPGSAKVVVMVAAAVVIAGYGLYQWIHSKETSNNGQYEKCVKSNANVADKKNEAKDKNNEEKSGEDKDEQLNQPLELVRRRRGKGNAAKKQTSHSSSSMMDQQSDISMNTVAPQTDVSMKVIENSVHSDTVQSTLPPVVPLPSNSNDKEAMEDEQARIENEIRALMKRREDLEMRKNELAVRELSLLAKSTIATTIIHNAQTLPSTLEPSFQMHDQAMKETVSSSFPEYDKYEESAALGYPSQYPLPSSISDAASEIHQQHYDNDSFSIADENAPSFIAETHSIANSHSNSGRSKSDESEYTKISYSDLINDTSDRGSVCNRSH